MVIWRYSTSVAATTSLTISPVALEDDPYLPGQKELVVGGTMGNDSIVFNPGGGKSGTVKVLSNVSGAMVLIDGQVVGKTPVVLDNIPAGEHLVEVKQSGYIDAKQPFHLDGGEQKILAADLTSIHHGPTVADTVRRMRGMTSFSGVTIDPARFTAPQVRKVRFDGDRMILVPPQVEVNGVKVTRELAWERISTVSL